MSSSTDILNKAANCGNRIISGNVKLFSDLETDDFETPIYSAN